MKATPRLPDAKVNLPSSHPLSDAAQLIAGVAGIGLVLFALIAYFVELALWLLPHESEAELAQTLWPMEAAATEQDERQQRLQALLDALAEGWEDNPYELQLRIMDDPQPNAFAAPGGIVLVTEGLLELSESENELAFVLAHEIGHFRGRDHLRGLGRGVLFQLVLASIGIGGGDVSLLGKTGLLAGLSFSREQEREADRFGLDLIQRHYGHVAGAGVFFERLAQDDPISARLPSFVSTHPGLEERVVELRKLARKRGYQLEGQEEPKL